VIKINPFSKESEYWLPIVIIACILVAIALVLTGVVHADTITLNYSENVTILAFNTTDNTTYNVTVIAPAQNICLPPPAIAKNLTYGECNTTNNFTACAPNETICSPPPAVSRTLAYGETNTTNNFTASCLALTNYVFNNIPFGNSFYAIGNVSGSCEAWNNASCPATQNATCPPPSAVSETLPWGTTHTVNNYTATCEAWSNSNCSNKTLTGLENQSITAGPGYHLWNPYLNFTLDVPYINNIFTLNPGDVLNLTTGGYNYKAIFVCSNSTVFCSANTTALCTPWINTANCTNFSTCAPQNITLSNCYNDTSIQTCSVKVPLCLSDFKDTVCTQEELLNGSVRKCLNDTLTSKDTTISAANNATTVANTNTQDCKVQLTSCESGSADNEKLGWGIAVVLAVVFIWRTRQTPEKQIEEPAEGVK
jgi:hypothetical protein